MQRRFAAEAALIGAALLYGVTFPLVHDALDDITPFAYLVGRFGIATLLLAPVTIGALRTRGPERRMLVRAGLVAGVILFGGYATQTIGLQYTSASTSAFLTGLYVIITPVIESAISRRLPRPPVIAGIVVATVGLYLLTGADVHLGRGELFTLACAVLFAWHIVYIGAYTHVLRPLPFGSLQIAAVGLLSVAPAAEQGVGSLSALAVFAVIFTGVACSADALPFGSLQIAAVGLLSVAPAAEQGVGSLSALAVFAVIFTGVACSAVALPLQLWGQQHIPATRAALILLAEPVFAGIAGYVNGERLDATQLTGAVAIMAGIAVSEFWPRRPVPEGPAPRGSVQP